MKKLGDENCDVDIVVSFQEVIVDILVKKLVKVLKQMGLKCLVIVGGVSVNKCLCECLEVDLVKIKVIVYYVELVFCIDNGVMIVFVGYQCLKVG